MSPGSVLRSRLVLALAFSWLIGVTAVSSAGVRGSDQFWYTAEVESIARGSGAVTNSVFPNPLLRRQLAPPYPPIHNHPLLYLVAPLAGLVGGYAAWLLLNVTWVLAIALLVRAQLLPRAREPLANLAAALFAVMPATLWQAGQPLADVWIALLLTLCVWSLCRPAPTAWRWQVAYAALLMAALSREFYAIPLFLLPFLYWRWSGAGVRRKLAWAGGMLGLATAAFVAKGHLFPQQLEPTPALAWRALSSRLSGMFLYFELGQDPPAGVGELLGAAGWRLVRALREHLLPPWSQTVFYLPFNLLAAVAASGWLRRHRTGRPQRVLVICSGLLVLHLLVIATQHASFRYAFVITPPLLVAALLRLRRWAQPTSTLTVCFWGAALVGSLVVGLALADKNRREGQLVRQLTVASRQTLDSVIEPGETVAFEAARPAPGLWYLWAGHALPSSPVLYLHPGFPYDSATYDRLLRLSGASWLICRADSPLKAALNADPVPVASLPDPSSWEVYRLPRP